MKAAAQKTSEVKDPFDLDDRDFLIGYRFLGIRGRKTRHIAKPIAKRKSKRSIRAKKASKA